MHLSGISGISLPNLGCASTDNISDDVALTFVDMHSNPYVLYLRCFDYRCKPNASTLFSLIFLTRN